MILRNALRALLPLAILAIGAAGPVKTAPAAPAGASISLPGVKLWYTDTGGTGVPIVLLHANTGTSANWASQDAAFAKAGYRVIAFDRRGWGKSVADPAGPQPGSVAEDLQGLVTALKLGKFFIVGVAGGGFVAIDYASWHPEHVRGLVVAASTGQFSEKEMTDFSDRIAIPGMTKLPQVYTEVSPSYRGGNVDGTAKWVEIEENAQQKGAPGQPLHTPNTFAKLATIKAPMLIMPADADLLAPVALMRVWGAHVKGAEWKIIGDSGHSIAWEKPDEFNAAVLSFVRRH